MFKAVDLWTPEPVGTFWKKHVKYVILSVPVWISKVYMFIVVCPESSKLRGLVCLLRNDCNCTGPADTFTYISNIPPRLRLSHLASCKYDIFIKGKHVRDLLCKLNVIYIVRR